jgi:hypothetical protein
MSIVVREKGDPLVRNTQINNDSDNNDKEKE